MTFFVRTYQSVNEKSCQGTPRDAYINGMHLIECNAGDFSHC